MKLISALTFIVIFTYSFSQDSISSQKEADMFSCDILYGQCIFKDDFYAQFNTKQHYSFTHPIQTIGISLSGAYVRDKRHDYAVHYSYSQLLPQQITLFDTLNSHINGFIFSVNMLGKDLLPKSKNANCIIGLGFNTGRFRISGNDYKQQKNPFFSPTISLQPKLKLGSIVLSLRGDLSYDISKGNWRSLNFSTKTQRFDLKPFKQTGLMLYFSIGWEL